VHLLADAWEALIRQRFPPNSRRARRRQVSHHRRRVRQVGEVSWLLSWI